MNFKKFYDLIQPYSITSKERIYGLYECLEEIRKNKIKGDMVECGIYTGGNILGICEYLSYYNITDVTVWGYDTFAGMTEPSALDIDTSGIKASDIFQQVKCECSYDFVINVLKKTNFPKEKIKLIVGDVLQTLNEVTPNEISLLRLDTDWYESTKKELEILYPKLVNNGFLIIDDFGHWQGSQLATKEYFNNNFNYKMFDYTGLCHQKKNI
jgi:O-methyltransferase